MLGRIARHRSAIITFVLATLGFVLIGLAHTFRFEWAKIQVDRLVAEAKPAPDAER